MDGLAFAFQSERLVYRAFENNEEDRQFLYKHIENDPVNTALADLRVIQPRGTKQANWLAEELVKAVLAVMICLPSADGKGKQAGESNTKTTPTPIGFLVCGWGGRPADQAQHRSISFGISLAAPYQDKGYGGEALNWALDWAFRFGGYHRVSLSTVSYNERAQHLYKRLGFVEEGRNREAHWHDRKWYDTISYGILESEWAKMRGRDE